MLGIVHRRKVLDCFLWLRDFLAFINSIPDAERLHDVRSLFEYFPQTKYRNTWVLNRGLISAKPLELSARDYDSPTETIFDYQLKNTYKKLPLLFLWQPNSGVSERGKTRRSGVPLFTTTLCMYVCMYETGFTRYSTTKTKSRDNRNGASDEFDSSLSN
jgi:hypothetical protein